MESSIHITKHIKIPQIGKIPLYLILVIIVFLFAVIQDYIYSKIKDTGFYISESLLYNTFWVFFIPFSIITNRIVTSVNPKNKFHKSPYNIGIGIVFSLIHLIAFTAFFVFISYLIFTPSHRFVAIFNTAFSNQFYIALLWYVLLPVVYNSKHTPSKALTRYPEKLKLKVGSKTIMVLASSIQFISTDKPYTLVYTDDQKILDNTSLKEYETLLNPTIFLRVHRSTIINSTYIKELKSRSNGDYDAKLKNGQWIRLSRHYRSNWHLLLH